MFALKGPYNIGSSDLGLILYPVLCLSTGLTGISFALEYGYLFSLKLKKMGLLKYVLG